MRNVRFSPMISAVSLPLALVTVILRRYLDKIFSSQGQAVVNNPWLIQPPLFKLCMYAYMFGVGLWCIPRSLKKGTVTFVAKKIYGGAMAIKNKCIRRKNRKSSWTMMKSREAQQRALQYVASLRPHPQPSTRDSTMGEPSSTSVDSNCNGNMPEVNPSPGNEPPYNSCAMANPHYSSFNHDPTFQNHEFSHCANNRAFSNEQQCTASYAPNAFQHREDTDPKFAAFNNQQIGSYGSNPYHEPKIGCISRNPCPFLNPRLSSPPPGQAPPRQPQPCGARCVQPDAPGDAPCTWGTTSDPTISKVTPANEPSVLSITDDSISTLLKTRKTKTKKCTRNMPPARNLYTLRGRKINPQDGSHDGKAAGKTRSGKVHKSHSNKSRRRSSKYQ